METSIVKIKNLWNSFYEEEKQQKRELLIDIIGQFLNHEIRKVHSFPIPVQMKNLQKHLRNLKHEKNGSKTPQWGKSLIMSTIPSVLLIPMVISAIHIARFFRCGRQSMERYSTSNRMQIDGDFTDAMIVTVRSRWVFLLRTPKSKWGSFEARSAVVVMTRCVEYIIAPRKRGPYSIIKCK